MGEFGDFCFHLTPLDIVRRGYDFMAGTEKFCIQVRATFMPEEDDLEESKLEELCDIECELKVEEFLVDRDRLLDDQNQETSRSIIRDILGDMNIPIRAFVIDGILDGARKMALDNHYLSRNVLYLSVRIEVRPGSQSPDPDDDDDDDIEGDELNMVPATKSAIEALEIVKVEGKQSCAVCSEELLIGGEATCLPCSHVYHSGCIRTWLERSKLCPLCRFEI